MFSEFIFDYHFYSKRNLLIVNNLNFIKRIIYLKDINIHFSGFNVRFTDQKK